MLLNKMIETEQNRKKYLRNRSRRTRFRAHSTTRNRKERNSFIHFSFLEVETRGKLVITMPNCVPVQYYDQKQ